MTKEKLTHKQQQVLDYVKDYIRKHTFSPTHEEIGKHFGWSKQNSTEYVKILVDKGYLEKIDMPYRNLKVKGKQK